MGNCRSRSEPARFKVVDAPKELPFNNTESVGAFKLNGDGEKECSTDSLSPSAALATADHSSGAFHKRREKLKQRKHLMKSRTVKNTEKSIEFRIGDAEGDTNGTGSSNLTLLDLEDTMHMAQLLLETRADEQAMSNDEIKAALGVYKELQRVLNVATRTGNLMARQTKFRQNDTPFHERYTSLVQEMDDAQSAVDKAMTAPAAVRPLSVEALQEVNDFFILDNSLRETTVGAARGHTMEEKLQIVNTMADTGLEEVILGAFGAKVSVDSQIAGHWKTGLGKSFDSSWGFSDAYDMTPLDEAEEEKLWTSLEERGGEYDFYTPKHLPRCTYSKEEVSLFKEASKGFRSKPFGNMSLDKVLKNAQSTQHGRVPLGLLMMAGYGICNAIIEVDASVETFDYEKYDLVERCRFLIAWCKEHFPRRENVPPGEDNTARVLINLRDFTNYNRSAFGLEQGLHIVHALSSLPPHERPFGFIIEEPTGFLWPDEVGRLCRMIRLTMNRAGFPQGRFLVHVHWYFGLAEAIQLACLCNGADGVWAAVCKVGAQVGHACSTMTAVNLMRAGNQDISSQYNLAQMCKAAREVTAISTRQPCPTHEEIYGEAAFDVPFMMVSLPACRFALAKLLKELKIDQRMVRLNEIILPSAIYHAMVYHFGVPEESGWDPKYCRKMYHAIHDHLMTGLSRDYNSALGLGHLYALVSQKNIPTKMASIMMHGANVSDYHPTVLEFIDRWNRLCLKYEGEDLPHPASRSKSIMMLGTDVTLQPKRESLPFEFFLADVMRNPVLEPVPRLFKLQVVSMVTKNERAIQHKRVPEVNFYEAVLRLKLFILEAESLGVLGLVDDFCVRKNHDYFFGEDHLWLQKVRGTKPRTLNKMLRSHIDFFPKYYMAKGNNAMVRCVRAAAKRIEDNKGINMEMQQTYQKRGSARDALKKVIEMKSTSHPIEPSGHLFETHEQMLKELVEDEGQDEEAAVAYLKISKEVLGIEKDNTAEDLVDAYLEDSKYNAAAAVTQESGQPRESDARTLIQNGLTAIENKHDEQGGAESGEVWAEV